jgi:hypothetical protein
MESQVRIRNTAWLRVRSVSQQDHPISGNGLPFRALNVKVKKRLFMMKRLLVIEHRGNILKALGFP